MAGYFRSFTALPSEQRLLNNLTVNANLTSLFPSMSEGETYLPFSDIADINNVKNGQS